MKVGTRFAAMMTLALCANVDKSSAATYILTSSSNSSKKIYLRMAPLFTDWLCMCAQS